MSVQPELLLDLYRLALEQDLADGSISAAARESMKAGLERVAAELGHYREQRRQASGVRQEQTRQDLKKASRFVSRSSVQQIRARQERSEGTAGLFYGFAPAEAAEATTAKEPPRIAAPAVEKRPWLKAGLASKAPVGRAPQVAGIFRTTANAPKLSSLLGGSSGPEAADASRSGGSA